MDPLQAPEAFAGALLRRGIDLPDPTSGATRGAPERWLDAWDAFCEVAALPFGDSFDDGYGHAVHETMGDQLSLECSSQHLLFQRQFNLEDADGEYSGIEALTLQVAFHEPLAPSDMVWADLEADGTGVEEWRQEVEATPAFRAALRARPVSWVGAYGPVG